MKWQAESVHAQILCDTWQAQSLIGSHCVVIWLLLHQLWCHVQRCTLDGCQDHGVARHGTSKAKVTQLDNPIGANQYILWLHVTMNNAVCVQIVQSADKLLGNTLHSGFRETLVIFQNLKQLACRRNGGSGT